MLKRITTPRSARTLLMAAIAIVFLRPLCAQTPAATLEVMTGQVSILQDPNSLSSAKPLFQGSQIKAQQMVITGADSYAKFRLADGSYFEVFENSRVEFHQDFGLMYLLNIVLGHIKVFIDHSKGPNYNSVTTPTAVISVRGTIFDIVVEDDDGTTLVTLEEGWVHVRNQTAPGFEPDLTKPGQQVRVFRGQGLIGKQINNNGMPKALQMIQDAVKVFASQHPGGIGIGGSPGGVGGNAPGIPGAQGDKGKGGAAPAPPPAAPPSSAGH
jgi:FecR-like protein